MHRVSVRLIALAPEEQGTLATLAEQALEPAAERLRGAASAVRIREAIGAAEALARIFEAAETGAVDVGDPIVRGWLSARRDALLALDVEDFDGLALIARLLSDALDVAAA